MSVLGDIISKIFSHASAAPAAPAATPTAAPAGAPAPASTPAAATPVDVTAILDKLAGQSKEKLDWRHSIVDMMKLLDLDSSLGARKHLAEELHYTGNMNDSASMNVWLHGQVMTKLAENGGKVPDDLKA
jgi:3-oxoacyl-ACP reductase-like protein